MLLESLLLAVVQTAHSLDSLSGVVTVDGDLGVLLPAAHVVWHLWEVDLLLEERVHLTLNVVLLIVANETSDEVDHSHGLEVVVTTGVAAHSAVLWGEDVLTVATVWDAVVNEALEHDLEGSVAVEGKIFTVVSYNLTVLLEAISDWSSIGSLVLDHTLGSNVLNVVARAQGELVVPCELAARLLSAEVGNSITDSLDTLLGAHGGLVWYVVHLAVEALLHILEVGDEVLGSLTNLVDELKDLTVHLLNLVVWVILARSHVNLGGLADLSLHPKINYL